jgi:trans-aconitate methyltransferase
MTEPPRDPDDRAPGSGPDGGTEWDPEAYDGHHSFVYEYGGALVDELDPVPGDAVLDLGCGTGHLTAALSDRGARAVGVDRAEAMVREAAADHPDPAFVRADARALPFDGRFDGVLSNAVLHWIPEADQDAVLEGVARALVPGGRFVAELGGVGNVAAILDAVGTALERRGRPTEHPWYFPTVGEYAARLEAAGFEVRLATLFDRPTELDGGRAGLWNWLDAFGDELFAGVDDRTRRAVAEEAAATLEADHWRGGTWVADYRRLRFVAVGPG